MILHTDVAVVGSGFSAVALSLNLLESLPATASVSLVGRAAGMGRGLAYSTASDCHLLNVPAGRMSLFSDRPDHFARWLAEKGHGATPEDFVPRRLYGDYVGDCLDAALKRTANRAALALVDAEAESAEAAPSGGLVFALSNGTRLSARLSALCTGAGQRGLPPGDGVLPSEIAPFVVQDPWAEAWWRRLPAGADVLFVGTGLTMVDQCLLLERHGFCGTMHAVSRHGLMPQAHLERRSEPCGPVLVPGEGDVSGMLATLRARAAAASDWRAVVDGLRPVTQAIWKAWTPAERARFLRHAASFWNVHRHRMAPAVAAEIDALRHAGRLVIHKGRLEGLRREAGGLAAAIGGKDLPAAMVVNCTGLDRSTVAASPLLASLARAGIVRPDPHGLGIAVDEDCAVVAADGRRDDRLYALGSLTAGRHLEITAVPDIRVQARAVAARIGAQL